MVDNSAVIDDFVKGFSDAFVDETGVNTGANVNATYQATPNVYAMSQVTATNTQIGADSSLWQSNTSNWTFGFSNSDGNAYGLESSEGSLGGNARTTIRTFCNAYDMTGDFLSFLEQTIQVVLMVVIELWLIKTMRHIFLNHQ